MWTISTLVIVAVALFRSASTEEEKVFHVAGLDSYLEAYRESQEAKSDKSAQDVKGVVKLSDREFVEWNPASSGPGYPPVPQ